MSAQRSVLLPSAVSDSIAIAAPDVLDQVIADAGPPTIWRPDTPEEQADRSEITAAAYTWQVESIARHGAQ